MQWLWNSQTSSQAASLYWQGTCLNKHLLLFILDTKSSSCKKNQKISRCNIFTVSGGYFARFTCVWTALYHSSMLYYLGKSLLKDQTRFSPHWIAAYKNLQTSPKLCQDSFLLWIIPRIFTDPFQSCLTNQ